MCLVKQSASKREWESVYPGVRRGCARLRVPPAPRWEKWRIASESFVSKAGQRNDRCRGRQKRKHRSEQQAQTIEGSGSPWEPNSAKGGGPPSCWILKVGLKAPSRSSGPAALVTGRSRGATWLQTWKTNQGQRRTPSLSSGQCKYSRAASRSSSLEANSFRKRQNSRGSKKGFESPSTSPDTATVKS